MSKLRNNLILIGMVLLLSSLYESICLGKETITLYWTDLGINQWNSTMELGDNFNRLNSNLIETIIVSESEGQILIPMPSDVDLPETTKGWQNLSDEIYQTLKANIDESLKSGNNEIEIRTIQDINLGGYFELSGRQEEVVKFTKAFVLALGRIKTELSSNYEVIVNGLWGSNGGFAASMVLPVLAYNPVNRGVLIDARAWATDVYYLYKVLKGNLTIINTAGDAPSKSIMVANHDTAKYLKSLLPDLKIYWVDPVKDTNIINHLASMHWGTSLAVKEVIGNKYVKLGEMTGGTLFHYILSSESRSIKQNNNIPAYFVNTDSEQKGKSMAEAQTLSESIHDKHKAIVAGVGPEADLMYKNMVEKLGEGNVKRIVQYTNDETLQRQAASFSADIILGVRTGIGIKTDGVYIDPKPLNTGKGGSEVKMHVLDSKPSDDTLSWDYQVE